MISGITHSSTPAPQASEARLEQACQQFEAVFITELLKNMRETIDKQAVADGGSAEDTFSAMLDEHISRLAAHQQSRGIADALYAQLRSQLGAAR